ncbi:MAG: hydrogenase maturation protease [Clostridia bacterium]|nr:hydrogenase maturation protease [Clostridia bacterium]MDQ7792448.1 hydrogenase maturation protease [Clostridia bacterium]
MRRTIVLGLGNILMQDDGIGVRVIEALQDTELPDGVELVDAGTGVYSLIYDLEGADRIIVVDAVQGGGEPGTVYRIPGEELDSFRDEAVSTHDIRFPEVMTILAQHGHHPAVVVYGVEPAEVDLGMELTPSVMAVLPRVTALVLDEIRST